MKNYETHDRNSDERVIPLLFQICVVPGLIVLVLCTWFMADYLDRPVVIIVTPSPPCE